MRVRRAQYGCQDGGGIIAPPVLVRHLENQQTIPLRRRAASVADWEPIPAIGLKSFSTTFSLTESPMSEGGVWTQGLATGLDWTNVDTNGADAIGTKDNGSNFDDSIACLSGFHPDQSASTVIHKGSTTNIMEVELLLRWQITSHNARGYEINWAHDGAYMQIVRWEGALNSFTPLQNFGPLAAPADGDTFYAQIVGNLITVKVNGSTIGTWDITTGSPANVWTTGNPGIGFYRTGGAAFSQYAYTSFTAVEL